MTVCANCGYSDADAGAVFCSRCGAPMQQTKGAAQASLAAPEAPAGGYAGFGSRFAALAIDWLIVGLPFIVLYAVLFFLFGGRGMTAGIERGDSPTKFFYFVASVQIVGIVSLIVTWIYEAAMTSSARQATLGKRAVGIYVVSLDSGRMTFARATGRHFAKYLNGYTFGVGYLMQPFTERKQALHDLIVRTVVLDGRPVPGASSSYNRGSGLER